jgi:hypothetical protein
MTAFIARADVRRAASGLQKRHDLSQKSAVIGGWQHGRCGSGLVLRHQNFLLVSFIGIVFLFGCGAG